MGSLNGARVALLAGCAQQVLDPDINVATIEVLARNGVEVIVPEAQGCCGGLAWHTGDLGAARAFARKNLDAFPADVDAILTNAAGGVNLALSAGTLMLLDDNINLMGQNPLAGPNDDRFGPRFPDMSDVYASRLRGAAGEAARASDVTLAHGVYAALLGPSYETPAEIRFLRSIGADAVGMSTVPEAIVARHMGIEVLGISCITNMAAGVLPQPLDHNEVLETTRRVRDRFVALLEGIIGRL